MLEIPFTKYQGSKNSFVIVSKSHLPGVTDLVALARHTCDPAVGVGSDGLFVVGPAGPKVEVEMFNPDGSLMGMCGNGIRCVYRYLKEHRDADAFLPTAISFSVEGRDIVCESTNRGQTVRVDMGQPATSPEAIPFTGGSYDAVTHDLDVGLPGGSEHLAVSVVSMGNPHCILVGDQALLERASELGPYIEHHTNFPARTNVEFVHVESSERLRATVWERGAGITQACGTGACAIVVALHRRGLCNASAEVVLPGGTLEVEWEKARNHVFLTGPAAPICHGSLFVE